jgi:microcystin-dependent protein
VKQCVSATKTKQQKKAKQWPATKKPTAKIGAKQQEPAKQKKQQAAKHKTSYSSRKTTAIRTTSKESAPLSPRTISMIGISHVLSNHQSPQPCC